MEKVKEPQFVASKKEEAELDEINILLAKEKDINSPRAIELMAKYESLMNKCVAYD